MIDDYRALLSPDGTLTRIPVTRALDQERQALEPGKIVSMIEHQGVLMVATESGVWALHEGSFYPIRFASSDAAGL